MSKLDIYAYFMISAFSAGFLSIFVFYGSMYLWFNWIKKMESILGSPGTSIGEQRFLFWGNTHTGRFFRVLDIFHYFMFLKIPFIGKKTAARVGKEKIPMSKRDRYIGFTLVYVFWLCVLYFGLVAWILTKVAPIDE